jgi:DNA-binding CsgD family transcriptional regulator
MNQGVDVTGVDWSEIIGRERELDQIRRFVDDSSGGLRVLTFHGEAGIGKTTLWRAAVASAKDAGCRVLECGTDESEAALSLTAVSDLLETVLDETLDELPDPQRSALRVAALRESGAPPDERAVSRACLSLFRVLSASGPLILAIDDIQWLDVSSTNVLLFALRRLAVEPVGLIASQRGAKDPLATRKLAAEGRVKRLDVGPLGIDELAQVIRVRLGESLPRPVLARLHEASGGNPFYALEMARTMGDRLGAGEEVPVPRNLRELVRGRLDRLSDPALEVLLITACLARPAVGLVHEVVGDAERADGGLAEAEGAGIIAIEANRIRFTHPLLRSVVHGSTGATKRRLLHRRLSEVVTDVEERARHLALAAKGPDEDTADVLEQAAPAAAQRGATAGAAQLLEQALELTPREFPAERHRRRLGAARRQFDSGNPMRAKELLQDAIDSAPPGRERAEALRQLASVMRSTDGVDAATQTFVRALDEAEGDGKLQASIHESLAWMRCFTGSVPGTYKHAKAAVALMEGVEDDALRMAVLTAMAEAEFHMGFEETHDTIALAMALEHANPDAMSVADAPTMIRSTHLYRMDDLDGAQELAEGCLERALAMGDEASVPQILYFIGIIEVNRGACERARSYAERAHEAALQMGQIATDTSVVYLNAFVDMYLGNVEEARRGLTETLKVAEEQHSHQWTLVRCLWGLGFVELSLGNLEQALAFMERSYEAMLTCEVGEPNSFGTLVPDYAEVLITLGMEERALEVLEPFEQQARKVGRRRSLADVARCRGLLLASAGDDEGAISSLNASLAEHETLPYRMELGRTLLALGIVHRRAKRKKLAREALERAIEVFEGVGAKLWIARARAEAARIGGRSPGPIELTDTERQVADLVVEGMSNREIAERLFLSVRTVEANLSKAYRKLQVRSRTELVRALSGR